MATDNEERWERGRKMMEKVYAGDVVTPPRGAMPFTDIMLEQVFAEVWSREDVLGIAERRLLLLGAAAAIGERDIWRIQTKAAVKNGELTPDQVRECLIHLAQYVGYPRVSGLVTLTEGMLAEVAKEMEEG